MASRSNAFPQIKRASTRRAGAPGTRGDEEVEERIAFQRNPLCNGVNWPRLAARYSSDQVCGKNGKAGSDALQSPLRVSSKLIPAGGVTTWSATCLGLRDPIVSHRQSPARILKGVPTSSGGASPRADAPANHEFHGGDALGGDPAKYSTNARIGGSADHSSSSGRPAPTMTVAGLAPQAFLAHSLATRQVLLPQC